MLTLAVVCFICSLVAALFGFGGIVAGTAAVAQALFIVFVAMAAAAFVLGLARGR